MGIIKGSKHPRERYNLYFWDWVMLKGWQAVAKLNYSLCTKKSSFLSTQYLHSPSCNSYHTLWPTWWIKNYCWEIKGQTVGSKEVPIKFPWWYFYGICMCPKASMLKTFYLTRGKNEFYLRDMGGVMNRSQILFFSNFQDTDASK